MIFMVERIAAGSSRPGIGLGGGVAHGTSQEIRGNANQPWRTVK
jgi:hypothetical protein